MSCRDTFARGNCQHIAKFLREKFELQSDVSMRDINLPAFIFKFSLIEIKEPNVQPWRTLSWSEKFYTFLWLHIDKLPPEDRRPLNEILELIVTRSIKLVVVLFLIPLLRLSTLPQQLLLIMENIFLVLIVLRIVKDDPKLEIYNTDTFPVIFVGHDVAPDIFFEYADVLQPTRENVLSETMELTH